MRKRNSKLSHHWFTNALNLNLLLQQLRLSYKYDTFLIQSFLGIWVLIAQTCQKLFTDIKDSTDFRIKEIGKAPTHNKTKETRKICLTQTYLLLIIFLLTLRHNIAIRLRRRISGSLIYCCLNETCYITGIIYYFVLGTSLGSSFCLR